MVITLDQAHFAYYRRNTVYVANFTISELQNTLVIVGDFREPISQPWNEPVEQNHAISRQSKAARILRQGVIFFFPDEEDERQ
jgi:hypothetical protein